MYELDKIVLLIPALNPDQKLVNYVKDCITHGWSHIVVVDDGSDESHQVFFSQVETMAEVVVLCHEKNRGKGAALKTGFSYCLEQFPEAIGVITADSDGQHSAKDTLKMAEEMMQNPDSFVLGTRDFDLPQVPFKSRYGNKITTNVFQLLYGKRIRDTQTGLRGISRRDWKRMCEIKGDRYEYEIRMLIDMVRQKVPIREVIIDTIYIDNNSESHFRPFRDSFRIYSVIFGTFFYYIMSSLSAAVIDIGLFAILSKVIFARMSLGKNVLLATIISRIVSSLYNFMCNKKLVFHMDGHLLKTAVKYYALAIVQMLCSAGLVYLFASVLAWNQVFVKMVVDVLLFFLSYQIQQHLVFAEKGERSWTS